MKFLSKKKKIKEGPISLICLFTVYISLDGFVFNLQILDDIFASEMQKFLGNVLQEKDLEPPRSIADVRSMLCKDAVNDNDNNYFY